jgi:hypothetical protein
MTSDGGRRQVTLATVVRLSIRVGMPLMMTIGGIVLVVLGHADPGNVSLNQVDQSPGAASPYTSLPAGHNALLTLGGVVLIGVAVIVVMFDWMMRMNTSSGKDRDREEAARDYFARTGHWPPDRPKKFL